MKHCSTNLHFLIILFLIVYFLPASVIIASIEYFRLFIAQRLKFNWNIQTIKTTLFNSVQLFLLNIISKKKKNNVLSYYI